ncbi:MAG: hypothetical protein Q8L98_05595 [Chlamydiales bacterium]|nr:hypothetical protein [Chlamydiales bacterium]
MKSIHLYTWIAAACCAMCSSFADEKIFIEPNCVEIAREGLFVYMNGIVVNVPRIYNDGEGPYVLDNEIAYRCRNGHFAGIDGHCHTPGCPYR